MLYLNNTSLTLKYLEDMHYTVNKMQYRKFFIIEVDIKKWLKTEIVEKNYSKQIVIIQVPFFSFKNEQIFSFSLSSEP